MDANAFQCNADFAGIVKSPLNGSSSHSEMYLQAQELFSAKRFDCPDLEKAARDENHYVSLLVDEYPLVADDKEFLARWFETFGKLSRGGRFLLKELRIRRRAFNEKNLQYFGSQGIDYEAALKELFNARLIEKPTKEKQSPPLSAFASDGMSFKHWQDKLIEVYVNTLINFVQNQSYLKELPSKLEKGILTGVKIVAVDHELCQACFDFRGGKNYMKKDIRRLPQLPLHWGCLCSYIPLTRFSN